MLNCFALATNGKPLIQSPGSFFLNELSFPWPLSDLGTRVQGNSGVGRKDNGPGGKNTESSTQNQGTLWKECPHLIEDILCFGASPPGII